MSSGSSVQRAGKQGGHRWRKGTVQYTSGSGKKTMMPPYARKLHGPVRTLTRDEIERLYPKASS